MDKDAYRAAMEKLSASPDWMERTRAAMRAAQKENAPAPCIRGQIWRRAALPIAAAVAVLCIPATWYFGSMRSASGGEALSAAAFAAAPAEGRAAETDAQTHTEEASLDAAEAPGAQKATQAGGTASVQGIVTRVDADGLTLTGDDGTVYEFTADTAALSLPDTGELAPGLRVEVCYTVDADGTYRMSTIAPAQGE